MRVSGTSHLDRKATLEHEPAEGIHVGARHADLVEGQAFQMTEGKYGFSRKAVMVCVPRNSADVMPRRRFRSGEGDLSPDENRFATRCQHPHMEKSDERRRGSVRNL